MLLRSTDRDPFALERALDIRESCYDKKLGLLGKGPRFAVTKGR